MWIVVDTFVTIAKTLYCSRVDGRPFSFLLELGATQYSKFFYGAVRVVPGGDRGVPRHITIWNRPRL